MLEAHESTLRADQETGRRSPGFRTHEEKRLPSGLACASGYLPVFLESIPSGQAAVLSWEHMKQDDMNQVEARKPQAVTSNDRSF